MSFMILMFFGLRTYLKLAGEEGIGPSYRHPKCRVLPLDDSPIFHNALNPTGNSPVEYRTGSSAYTY